MAISRRAFVTSYIDIIHLYECVEFGAKVVILAPA